MRRLAAPAGITRPRRQVARPEAACPQPSWTLIGSQPLDLVRHHPEEAHVALPDWGKELSRPRAATNRSTSRAA